MSQSVFVIADHCADTLRRVSVYMTDLNLPDPSGSHSS